ncbi:MAG: substrate-binding domain-containing protein [Lachnospirales bacterium]
MKKIFSSLLIGTMIITMASCSSNSDGDTSTNADGSSGSTEITVISREDGSGTRGAFIELFGILEKDNEGSEIDNTYEEAIFVNSTSTVITNVSSDENAIGYISLGSLNDTVTALPVDGTEATAENIKEGTYNVFREFNIVYGESLSELGNDFLTFIYSKEGQEVVGQSYIPFNEQGESYEAKQIEGKLVISGSTSVAPLIEKIVEAYKEQNSLATIEIQPNGSSAGVNDAINGVSDIGMASRSLKEDELVQINGSIIAYDGLAIIVNNENNFVTGLSSEQVKNIFTGETNIWEDLQ